MSDTEPGYHLESIPQSRSLREIQNRLQTLSDKDYIQPNDPEVVALKVERGPLLREADDLGLFTVLRKSIADKQKKIGQGGYTFQEVVQEIAGIDAGAIESRRKKEIINTKGNDAWNPLVEGSAETYRNTTLLVTEDAWFQAWARLAPDAHTRELARQNAEDLHRQVEILSWGSVPEEVYTIARIEVEKEIEAQRMSPHQHGNIDDETGLYPWAETKEIFGEEKAFTERWTNLHGIPNRIGPSPQAGITREFSPANTFSEVLETGIASQPQWYQVSMAVESAPDKKFRIAGMNGLVRLLNVHGALRSGRIDTVANTLKEGPTPQGLAEWLSVDQETRRSLALLFRLQGYEVADERDDDGNEIHDEIPGLERISVRKNIYGVRVEKGDPMRKVIRRETVTRNIALRNKDGELQGFFDFEKTDPKLIEEYLKEVQKAVGTDPGVVKLAYTIFRIMGFPHGNTRFLSLHKDYLYEPETDHKKGDLERSDVSPFIERGRFSDPTTKVGEDRAEKANNERTLEEILSEQGVLGFAKSLNRLPAEVIAREWGDMQLILDIMDKIKDIRTGQGAAANLPPEKRLQAIQGLQELQVAMAKRRFEEVTITRILSPKKINLTPAAGESSFWQKTRHGISAPLSGLRKKPGHKP